MDGKFLAATRQRQLCLDVARFRDESGLPVGLATLLIGDDPASEVYVANKRRSSVRAGIVDHHRRLPATASASQVAETIDELAASPEVSGILLQLPLPPHLNPGELINRIPWQKDVDGLTTISAGLLARGARGLRPCTPSGVIALLDAHDVPLGGAKATVVGRSELVGRPLAQMLIQRNATVTIAHSGTRDLRQATRGADLIIAAAGVPGLLTAEDVSHGAVVVDVGIHRTATGLVGDVDYPGVAAKASKITPVPGGVGPMTITELLVNTLKAARLQAGLPDEEFDLPATPSAQGQSNTGHPHVDAVPG